MTISRKKIEIQEKQLSNLKHQCKLFFKELKKNNIEITGSNHLNIFSKLLGYKSYGEIKLQARGLRKTTTSSLFLADTEEKINSILNAASEIPELSPYLFKVKNSLSKLPLPQGGFDLLDPNIDGNYSFIKIEIFSAITPQKATYQTYSQFKKYEFEECLGNNLFKFLRHRYKAHSALVFSSKDFSGDASNYIPDTFSFKLSKKLNGLHEGKREISLAREDNNFKGFEDTYTNEESIIPSLRVRKLFVLMKTANAITTSKEKQYITHPHLFDLDLHINKNSLSSFNGTFLFASTQDLSLSEYIQAGRNDDSSKNHNPDKTTHFTSFINEVFQCDEKNSSDSFSYVNEQIKYFLNSKNNPLYNHVSSDEAICYPLHGFGDKRLGYVFITKEKCSLYLYSYDIHGSYVGKGSSLLHNIRRSDLFKNVKVFFEDDYSDNHDIPLGRPFYLDREEVVPMINTDFTAALDNTYLIKPAPIFSNLKGSNESNGSYPWIELESSMKDLNVFGVVADIMCEKESKDPSFIILSFVDNANFLHMQWFISIADIHPRPRKKRLGIFDEFERLGQFLDVSLAWHPYPHTKMISHMLHEEIYIPDHPNSKITSDIEI